jgi:spermidine synthase
MPCPFAAARLGRPAFDDVLIIGAGSGNDVSCALDWGARHVDAVEIDPVIPDDSARAITRTVRIRIRSRCTR